MTQINFDQLYLNVLENGAKYFEHSGHRLTDLTDEQKARTKAYLEGEAKNNPELKQKVISALQEGLNLVPHEGDNYQVGEKGSLLIVSGALGSYDLVKRASLGEGVFTEVDKLKGKLTGAVEIDFQNFERKLGGAQFTDDIYFNSPSDYSRIRPICSGIDTVLRQTGAELKAQILADNKLDPEATLAPTTTAYLQEEIARNQGGVSIIGMALTPKQASNLPSAKGKEFEATASAVNYARYFQTTLSKLEGAEVTLFNADGQQIFHKSKAGEVTCDTKALAEWYRDCGTTHERFPAASHGVPPTPARNPIER